jgi:5-deoxy-glucuronate isomerase
VNLYLVNRNIKRRNSMKYFASLEIKPGLTPIPYNPCELLGFDLLKLAPGETYSAATGDREVLAVILGGKATFEVVGTRFEKVGGRPNVFGGKPHSVYMPAGASYTIAADSAVEIALTSAPSDLAVAPYVIGPERVASGAWGAANFKRYFHQSLTLAAQPDLPARRLIVGETFTPSGTGARSRRTATRWTICPARPTTRKSTTSGSIRRTARLCRYYNDQGDDINFTVRDNT